MSQENVEPDSAHARRLRALFDEWELGDFTSGAQLFASDIRYSAAQPEGQVRADGFAGMVRFMRGFLATWDRYWIELHALDEVRPGAFLATATQHGLGKGSGVAASMPAFIAICVSGTLIAQLEFFYERGEALRALGLGE